eukprot:73801_1
MGASRLIDTGLADDQHENKYDTVFEDWSPNLFKILNCDETSSELMDLSLGTPFISNLQLPSPLTNYSDINNLYNNQILSFPNTQIIMVVVVVGDLLDDL